MGFLLTRVDQFVDVMWLGDPDAKTSKKDEGRVVEHDPARVKAGGSVDVFTLRPLNNRELLSLGAYMDSGPGMAIAAVEMCWLGCTKIKRSDGSATEDPAEIRRIIDEESPPDFVSDLSAFLHSLTLGGGEKKT